MTANHLGHTLTGKLEQQQLLSASQQHSLEILSLPLAALESRIAQEFAKNPLLEEVPPESPEISQTPESAADPEDENDYERNAACPEEWRDELPIPGNNSGSAADELDYLGNSPAPPPSLKTALLNELECSGCPDNLYPAAVEIISALDDDGFVSTSLADLAMTNDMEMPEMEAALHWVQMIAPAGVAARDVAESLKLQLDRLGKLDDKYEKLLTAGREDLEKNRIPALCELLDVTPETLENMLRTLRSLNPVPGRTPQNTAVIIIPDLEIIPDGDDSFRCIVRREHQARIIISPLYEKLLEKPDLAPDDRAYLTEKIARAKELFQALAMRESTLKRLGDVIITTQHGFLTHGAEKLRPLTMKQAAELLDLSESTISRAVAEKFADTPKGIYPLRYFFSGGFSSNDGSEVATQAVKEKIRNAIAGENPRSPLSDEAIAAMLKSEGLAVARRTVAKYRESMKIPASSLRKKHF